MSFLNPLLWLGALALAAPVWLHLRERPARDVVPFSAVRFLEDAPRPRSQPLRLRDLLLLALRSAALLLVVGAFTWPYWRGAAASRVTTSRVHILDNTMSRQVDGGFDEDRRRLRQELATAVGETQDAVIELTAQPRVVAGFGDTRADALAHLDALAPSFERGSYLEAFRLAASLLDQSLGDRRQIVVHGDGQENQWSEHETVPPFLRGVEVVLAGRPAAAQRPNLSLSTPVVRRLFQGNQVLVELTARLRHDGGAPTTEVAVRSGGRQVLRKTMPLEARPGTLTLAAQWPAAPGDWVMGELSVEGKPDDLAGDDAVYFSLPPVQEGRVALLAQSTYLRAALSPDVMKGRWVTQAAEPWSEVGRSGELSDVLVLEATYLQSEKVRDLTLRYLGEGRGVLLFVERDTPLVEAVLRELGLEPRPRRGAAGREVGFRYLAADHPIFQPFLSPDFGSLTGIRVRDYLPLKATGANGLLFAETGDAVVFEGTRTKGRLLVFGFGINRSQTNWAVDPTFIPFLDLCLQYVRDEAPREATLLPGEPHVLDPPKGDAVREVVLNAGSEVVGRAPVEGGRATLRLPRRPGLYVVTHDADPTPQAVLAVNPSPKESILRYVAEPPALQAWQAPPASPPHAGPSSRRAAASRQAAADQRLWWWALAAAGLLLAAETSWLTWRKERA